MGRIEIFYTACVMETQNVSPNLPGLQSLNLCIQYLSSHHHKPIFYPHNFYDGSNFIRLTWSGNQVEE